MIWDNLYTLFGITLILYKYNFILFYNCTGSLKSNVFLQVAVLVAGKSCLDMIQVFDDLTEWSLQSAIL